jgi:hypothetical protein
VLLVIGENCSGKSFFVETLRAWASGCEPKIHNAQIAIRERTGAGASDMAGMRRTFIFGDKAEHSTGATSAGVLDRAFSNVQGTPRGSRPCVLILR